MLFINILDYFYGKIIEKIMHSMFLKLLNCNLDYQAGYKWKKPQKFRLYVDNY